jgi:predicted aspartyl protease
MVLLGVTTGAIMTDMGIFRTDIEIENHARRGEKHLLRGVLVDTGAEYSWAPAKVLVSLGIERRKRRRFQQADGSVLERDVGFAIIHAGGEDTTDEVVFGEPNDMVLLGARSLEGMNLKLDIVGKKLVPAGPVPAMAAAYGLGRSTGATFASRRRASATLGCSSGSAFFHRSMNARYCSAAFSPSPLAS